MKYNVSNSNYKKASAIPWLFLTIIAFILSAVILFSLIPPSLAAQTTMEVYQQEGQKSFGQETSLDIFNDPKLSGKKLVHPFTKGSYTFGVHNNSNSDLLPYALNISSTNPEEIPLVFSLKKNGEYIYGGNGKANMIPLSEINFSETMLDGNKTDLYTINWEWETDNDTIDTAIGRNGTQLYTLVITATGTMPEIRSLSPKTGYNSNMPLLFAIAVISSLVLLFMLFYKRRKDEDECNETVSENM